MAKSTSAPAAPDSKGSPPPLASIQDFLFGAPLYTNYDLNAAADLSTPFVSIEIQMFDFSLVVDSHCPDCHAASTFSRTNGPRRTGAMRSPTLTNCSYFELTCARRGDHKIRFWFKFNGNLIEKVGQYPSLADIANDESRLYRLVLEKEDAAELHKAMGLAAHGIGVGSFVYLRAFLKG